LTPCADPPRNKCRMAANKCRIGGGGVGSGAQPSEYGKYPPVVVGLF
jgi:hypothetical protein